MAGQVEQGGAFECDFFTLVGSIKKGLNSPLLESLYPNWHDNRCGAFVIIRI